MDFRCSRAPQQAFGLGSRTTTKASIMFACAYITGSCNACRSYNTISKESLPASRRRPPTMSRLSVAKAYFALCFLFFAGLVTANDPSTYTQQKCSTKFAVTKPASIRTTIQAATLTFTIPALATITPTQTVTPLSATATAVTTLRSIITEVQTQVRLFSCILPVLQDSRQATNHRPTGHEHLYYHKHPDKLRDGTHISTHNAIHHLTKHCCCHKHNNYRSALRLYSVRRLFAGRRQHICKARRRGQTPA
jgi:hypothetical protein